MAEILLSLTIIGVVAAITLPSLTGNINERTWNTQRKALYARMSQAVSLMPALNGYGTLTEDADGNVTKDTAAETFVTNGLSKVLKINNICDSDHIGDCGVPTKILDLKGTTNIYTSEIKTLVGLNAMFNSVYSLSSERTFPYSQTDTKVVAFETQNGESILTYYNPHCRSKLDIGTNYAYLGGRNEHPVQPFMCANFIYDLNGKKGPNSIGKDVGFMSVLYPSDSVVVMPLPARESVSTYTITHNEVGSYCKKFDENSRIPNRDELASLFYNKKLLGWSNVVAEFWSSELTDSTHAWSQRFATGLRNELPRTSRLGVICVKR